MGEVRLIYEMGRFKAPRLHVQEGDVSFCISVFLSTLSLSNPPSSAACKMQHASSASSLFSSALQCSHDTVTVNSQLHSRIFSMSTGTDESRIISLK